MLKIHKIKRAGNPHECRTILSENDFPIYKFPIKKHYLSY